MHEVSIINSCLDIVFQQAKESKLKKVNKISLKVGELSGVMADSLVFAFNAAIKGTIAEKAELMIDIVEAKGICSNCKVEFKIERFNRMCPECGEFCKEVLSGHELYINTIDGDE